MFYRRGLEAGHFRRSRHVSRTRFADKPRQEARRVLYVVQVQVHPTARWWYVLYARDVYHRVLRGHPHNFQHSRWWEAAYRTRRLLASLRLDSDGYIQVSRLERTDYVMYTLWWRVSRVRSLTCEYISGMTALELMGVPSQSAYNHTVRAMIIIRRS